MKTFNAQIQFMANTKVYLLHSHTYRQTDQKQQAPDLRYQGA